MFTANHPAKHENRAMSTDALIAPFTRIALFDGLAADQLERVARAAERIVYQAGDTIQSEGDISDAAVLIVAGQAELVDDVTDEAGEDIEAGSLVGELAMLIETRAASTIVARTPVRACRISRRRLRQLMESDPSLAEHLMDKITERLHAMATEMRRVDSLIAASVKTIPVTMHGRPNAPERACISTNA